MDLKKLLLNWRMIILILVLLLSVVAIRPNFFAEGAAVRSVDKNSSAELAGMISPKPTAPPMTRERIEFVNEVRVKSVEDYFAEIGKLSLGDVVDIKTNKGTYSLHVRDDDLGLNVYEAPKTNLRKGLELQGGTRVILQPVEKVSKDTLDILIASMSQRLNVFGISDVVIRPTSDLSGNQFILVEIAGANEEEVKNLIAQQGKFEAKIGNVTVFTGGKDITYVCRSADCSGLDPSRGCGQSQDGWACGFRFSITLSPEAAKRQADETKLLQVVSSPSGGGRYLSKPIDLYLDDNLVDTLQIGSELKGRPVTDISISGGGAGRVESEAAQDALANMKKLQTILITGSLPVKLNVVKTDAVSAVLGQDFVKAALLMSALAIIAVTIVIYVRYRLFKVTVPIVITMISEAVILLGVASLIGWNLDIASIAGILVAIGTGVDDQIVITDETLRGERGAVFGWKEKMKRAFFIIFAAYFTLVAAMIPLLFAGAGLLKGFAITSIIGVSVGVFITRPAYAAIVEHLVNK